jgi:hypothetical protein
MNTIEESEFFFESLMKRRLNKKLITQKRYYFSFKNSIKQFKSICATAQNHYYSPLNYIQQW